MSGLSANRMLSGSFAEVWVDGSRIAEASAIQLTVKMLRSDVQIGMDVDSRSPAGGAKDSSACGRCSAGFLTSWRGPDRDGTFG